MTVTINTAAVFNTVTEADEIKRFAELHPDWTRNCTTVTTIFAKTEWIETKSEEG